MKITKKIARLLCDLEYEIGTNCYNPNSYDGWNQIDGCEFRYPINFPDDGDYIKIRGNVNNYVDKNVIKKGNVEYMKYKFGSNELYIGQGLINVLSYLEKRYDLDFNELEKNRKK